MSQQQKTTLVAERIAVDKEKGQTLALSHFLILP